MLESTGNSINGWSLRNINQDSVNFGHPLIHADVYYKGIKVGEYTESEFLFDIMPRTIVLDVFFKRTDNYDPDYLKDRYLTDCELWHSYLEEQFGESFYNQSSIANVLLSILILNTIKMDRFKEVDLNSEFVLNYIRCEFLVGGVSFETYKLTSTTLIKNGTFEDYKKEASIFKDYPILLPSKFTCQ